MDYSKMTLSEALLDYYRHQEERVSIGAKTWGMHERQLEKFRAFAVREAELGPGCYLHEVDERTMGRYFKRMAPGQPGGVAASTYNNYRQYNLAFWMFCLNEGWINRNPMRHIDVAPVPKRNQLRLSAQELLMLLDGANPRDRIAMVLAMNTGLRAMDIMKLKISDVNLSNDYLSVNIQKTKKADELPITEELREELFQWFMHYAEKMGLDDWHDIPDDWTLVPPAHSHAVTMQAPEGARRVTYRPYGTIRHPEVIVNAAIERLPGVKRKKGTGFHTLRRSAARVAFEFAAEEGHKNPIRVAKSLLGHEDQKTTETYIGLESDRRDRDELLRGKSFLRKAADTEIAAHSTSDELKGRRRRSA